MLYLFVSFNQTVAYTNKHALPNDSHSREILIRRHASIRRSLRPGSFQSSVSRKLCYCVLNLVRSKKVSRIKHYLILIPHLLSSFFSLVLLSTLMFYSHVLFSGGSQIPQILLSSCWEKSGL